MRNTSSSSSSDVVDEPEDVDVQAALAFEGVLRSMVRDGTSLTPSVLVRVTALLGALLAHYSPYSRDELVVRIDGAVADPEVVRRIYEQLVALGIVKTGG